MDRETLPQGKADCPRCAALEAQVRDLERRIADLEDRLRANSSNSSNAPSSDKPWEMRYPKKRPSGRRPGGQPGHRGHCRQLLPPEQVDQVLRHRPQVCDRCGSALAPEAPAVVASRHQVAELPPKLAQVTEHQALACRCGRCGKTVRGQIPPAVRGSCTGPRLTAALGYLSARVHGSRRAAVELVRELLGVPLALGSLLAKESELAQALAGAYAQVQQQVRQAPAKNVDETGWFLQGQPCWLWTAATPQAALFHVDRCRCWYALQRLLGDAQGRIFGTLCTDRFGVYDYLQPGKRALCWAHLQRDFQRLCDRGGKQKPLGEEGLAIAHAVCVLFGQVKQGRLTRPQLQRRLERSKRRMKALLEAGLASGISKVQRFCAHLRQRWRALWTFARVPDLEPTNNHAERMLRPAVIWRNTSFGCSSDQGCRFVERMLSVIQTCRLQGRGVLAYLGEALHAYRHGLPTPKLV
jgi:transposase